MTIKKFENIISGFSNIIFTKKDIELLAAERKLICKKCIKCRYGSSLRCLKKLGGCGCFLPAKSRVPDEECPDLLWKAK